MVSNYSPNGYVLASHDIPVFDQNLRPIQVDFSISVEYLRSLIIFPIFIFICTAAICLFYLVALCFRFVHRNSSCRCGNHCTDTRNIASTEEKIYRRSQFERIFILSLISTACVACFLFLGSARVSTAFHIIANGTYQLIELLNSAIRFVGNILFHVILVRHFLSSSLCSGFDSVLLFDTEVDLQNIVDASDSLKGFTYNVLSSLHSLENTLRYAAVAKKHVAVGILFALILLAVALQLLSLLFRNEIFMRVAAGVTFLVVLVLLIVGSAMMLPVKVMGDFCMAPSTNFVQLFKGNLARVVSFYVFCSGDYNPLQREVDLMESVIADAERVLLKAKPSISPQCYDAVQSNYSAIASNISSLAALLPCPSLNRIYSDMVLVGVCSNGATGLYNIWILVFLLAAVLFVGLCLGNLIYAHFGLHVVALDEAEQRVEEGHATVPHATVYQQHDREGQVVAAGRNRDDAEEEKSRAVEMVSIT